MKLLVGASCRPVYFRVPASDEKFAVAIVGKDDSGQVFARSIASKIFSCLPDDLANALFTFGTISVEDFRHQIGKSIEWQEWVPPISGLEVGTTFAIDAESNLDLPTIAASRFAFGDSDGNDNLTQATSSEQTAASRPKATDEARFVKSVKDEVNRLQPSLVAGFKRSFSLSKTNVVNEIDFVGSHYATCYAAINPKARRTLRLTHATAALWRLLRARDAIGFAGPNKMELSAWTPPRGQPIYSDSDYQSADEMILELRAQAKKEDLEVAEIQSSMAAAERLIGFESQSSSH